jgi:betaine reductase
VDLKGKKVITLGERDSVPGEAIAECLSTAGAEIVLVETECFV